MNHLKPKKRVPNPEQKANWFSNLFFLYVRKISAKGYRTELKEDDIYEVPPNYKSKNLGDKMEEIWDKEKSIPLLLWKCFGKQYLIITVTLIISMTVTYSQPKLFKKFVSYFTADRKHFTKLEATFYAVALIFVIFIRFTYIDNFQLRLITLAFKVRAAFMSLIYRKVLKMRTSEVGKVITLITRDVNEFQDAIQYMTYMWTDFLRFLVTCCVLYTEIGWLFNILVVAVIASILINGKYTYWREFFLAYLVSSPKLRTLQKTDERYQRTKEVLSRIKLVKSYSWGDIFKGKIFNIRREEIRLIHKIYFLLFTQFNLSETILNALWYIMVVSSIWFAVETNAGTLFLIMGSIEAISLPLKYNFPNGLHETVTLVTVLKRIGKFLRETHFESSIEVNTDVTSPKVTLSHVDIYISGDKMLQDVNLSIDKGVTAVTGPVGSGKTLLLNVMMREHQPIEGNLKVEGRFSYASQEPWLFPSTIKQNILFGASYNKKRYLEVLRVCGLLDDLESMRDGDSTIAADRGANLSKGQQAKINLARAIYKDCDIYLLDDCFASLDVVVANLIYTQCVRNFLKDKVVLMVTKNQHFIEGSDKILMVNNGRAEFVHDSSEVTKYSETIPVDEKPEPCFKLLQQLEYEKKIYTEKKQSGKVAFDIYRKYIQYAGGVFLFCIVSVLMVITQVAKSSVHKLESNWISEEQNIVNLTLRNLTNSESYVEGIEKRQIMYYVFPILLIGVVTLLFIKAGLYCLLAKKASVAIHKIMFTKVMNATMQFFDNHLLGNILNRFSEDLLFVDEKLTYSAFYIMEYFFGLIGIVVLIATVNATFLIPCLILCVIVIATRNVYIRTGRALKRLELSVRSPFVGHINATIEGLSTIRTSKVEKTVCDDFDNHQDLYTSTSYMYICCFKGFQYLVHIYGTIFIAFVIVRYLIFDTGVTVGDVGLVFSQAFMFAQAQLTLFRLSSTVESEITAVERILEYTKQKQEPRDGFVVENWPSRGAIKYENVWFSYKNHDYKLRNLNFTIGHKEKIAVMGKNASGKTSLTYLLLRLYQFEGKISIDDVDITTLKLDFLRSKISLIPQEPFIFSGTLRENIDPTGKYTDDEVWRVIKKIQLEKTFSHLDYEVSSTSLNLSVGQKQLICLGRALLRNDKIVILDEVTANVDSDTEKIIHGIVRESFSESTVIMITHNLNYAIQYDKIIVLDEGEIVQCGTYTDLLKDDNGIFYRLFKKYI